MSLELELLDEFKNTGTCQDLEKGLLIVAGVDTENKIQRYKEKLDLIDERFQEYLIDNYTPKPDIITKAQALHEFLWQGDHERYLKENGHDIKKAINIKVLEKKKPEGNCQILTSLYSILGQRNKLLLLTFVRMVKHEERGRHVNSLLVDGNKIIVIENSIRKGFNHQNMKYSRRFKILSLESLIGFSFLNRGAEKKRNKEYKEALEDYNNAILINPDIGFLYLIRSEVKFILGFPKGGKNDLYKGFELEKKFLIERYESIIKYIEKENKNKSET